MRETAGGSWAASSFGALCLRIVNGGTPDTGIAAYWNGETPWITGADFTSSGIGEFRRYVSDAGIRSSATSVVKQGNLLVVTRTGVGKLAIAPCDIAISQDITGVYIDPAKAETAFAYYLLSRELDQLKKLNQGTSINGIVRSDLEKHIVRFPAAKAAQQRISAILTATDTAIEKTEALIAKYQQVKAGLMHDLFTRGVQPNGQLRPPRSEAPEMYQETATGWIPREWEVKALKEIYKNPIRDFGSFSSTNLITFLDEGVPFIKSEMIKEEVIDWKSTEFISEKVHELLRKSHVSAGNVLFSKIGSALGKAVLYDGGRGVCNSNAAVAKIEIDERVALPKFIEAFLNSDFARQQFRLMIVSLLPRINLGDIDKLKLQMPTIDEQRLICKCLDAVKVKLSNLQEDALSLKNQKLGLMQDLLTGKVPVQVTEPEAVYA